MGEARNRITALWLVVFFGTTVPALAEIAGPWQSDDGLLRFTAGEERHYDGDYQAATPYRLQGRLTGRRLEGTWVASESGARPCAEARDGSHHWGRIQFDFDPGFTHFAGRWRYCDEARWQGSWTGRRQGDGAARQGFDAAAQAALDALAVLPTGLCSNGERFTLAVHGGTITQPGRDHDAQLALMRQVLIQGRDLLAGGAKALDVVEGAIATFEDSGLFNAGRGAIANKAGDVELDAALMAGRDHRAGAVAALRQARNPIAAARQVMEQSEHVLMVGPGGDAFVRDHGGATVEQRYFSAVGDASGAVALPEDLAVEAPAAALSPARAGFSGIWRGHWGGGVEGAFVVERVTVKGAEVVIATAARPGRGLAFARWTRIWAPFDGEVLRFGLPVYAATRHFSLRLTEAGEMQARYHDTRAGVSAAAVFERQPPEKHGTVGAVALDRCGDLAAGTSTGGYASKTPGRVGASPIIGAGTYADNETAAISATGHGEYFIRYAVAHDITARMRYGGMDLEEAATRLIEEELPATGLTGGVIAIDRRGTVVTPHNTVGMLRGSVGSDRPLTVADY